MPRSLLGDFFKMTESKQVGVYFLIGGSDGDNPSVYIGQTGELGRRLAQHDKDTKKDFWERALVLVSRTNSLTSTHALFLEWHSLRMVREAKRYKEENGTGGSNPHTPPPLEAECLEIFDTGKTLMATLGYPIFQPIRVMPLTPDAEEIFYCNASDSDGRGLYTQEGFVVLEGSSGRLDVVPSFAGTTWDGLRQRLVRDGVLKENDGRLVFTKDVLFNTPSKAAAMLTGRSANGYVEWKTMNGQTLHEARRASKE